MNRELLMAAFALACLAAVGARHAWQRADRRLERDLARLDLLGPDAVPAPHRRADPTTPPTARGGGPR